MVVPQNVWNIYEEGDLRPEGTHKEFLSVRQEGKMRDWTVFLDKFLRDTELTVLDGVGSVSQEDAHSWAESQYDAFAERRRLLAEQTAEKEYVDDLESTAKKLVTVRKKPTAKRKGGKKHT